ncbi:MAG: hypothetical protein HQL59_12290 [Magnetococcales bacterium]|nr:hypothetical protein [Magnetococcales bacterium]
MTGLEPFILRGVVLLLGVGCLGALFLGLWLLVRPEVGGELARPVGSFLSGLRRPWQVERVFYRHSRWFGSLIVLGSLFTFLELWGQVGVLLGPEPDFGPGIHGVLMASFWEGLALFFQGASLVTLLVGILVLWRPSLLKPLESWANRSYSWGGLMRWLGGVRRGLVWKLRDNPRLLALLMVLGSGFVLVRFWGQWGKW